MDLIYEGTAAFYASSRLFDANSANKKHDSAAIVIDDK
jgi:hypothetical protein